MIVRDFKRQRVRDGEKYRAKKRWTERERQRQREREMERALKSLKCFYSLVT